MDLSEDSIILEVTGDPGKTAAIEQVISNLQFKKLHVLEKYLLVRGSKLVLIT